MEISKYNASQFSQVLSLIQGENNAMWTKNNLESSLKNEDVLCIVAKKGEKVLGFILTESSLYDIDILEIVVREDMRRKGIAQMLLEYISKWANIENKEKITLEVARSNFPAISLYEKNGYIKISERKKYYNNGEDALIYQKVL